MDRIQQIKEAHPWLDYEDLVKVLIYHHQGFSWIHNLQRDKLQQSMDDFSKLVYQREGKPLNPL